MTRLPLVLAALLALVAVQAAGANTRTVSDPRNDAKGSHYPGPAFYWATTGACAAQWTTVATNGCGDNSYSENQGGLLDLASARHGHGARGMLVHRLTWHRAWRNSLLTQGAQISLYITTDGDAAFERRIDVGLQRGRPVAIVRNGSGRTVGRGAVTRANLKTAQITFARSLLGPGQHTQWFAFSGIKCKGAYNACGDRSPGGSLVTHHLG